MNPEQGWQDEADLEAAAPRVLPPIDAPELAGFTARFVDDADEADHRIPDAAPPVPGPRRTDGAFDGPAEFADAVRHVMRHAEERGALQLRWCDEDFAAWPLGEPAFVDLLTRWMQGGPRELVMVAAHYGDIVRLHPRFARWRQDWSHRITCLEPAERREEPLPALWMDSEDQVVRVFDRDAWRGRAGADRLDRQQARERLDAILQRATPAFGAYTLGL